MATECSSKDYDDVTAAEGLDMLQKALAPLGFECRIVFSDLSYPLNWSSRIELRAMTCYRDFHPLELYCYGEWQMPTSLAEAFNHILGKHKCEEFFDASKQEFVHNPYFGCTSLDAIRVQIDLLSIGDTI